MGRISSTVTESVTGTRHKEPVAPTTAGVLSIDWQQLAVQAKQAEKDMHEVAETALATSTNHDVRGAAKDIIETSQCERCEAKNRHRQQPAVNRNMTPAGSTSKDQNDIEMEF